MKEIANALLVSSNGSLLMQRRDDKPTISNPGKITGFGGAIEAGETPLDAIVREVSEETNLRPTPEDFNFSRTYQKQMAIHGDDDRVHFFILRNVVAASLKVFEGQGFVEVTPATMDAYDFSILAHQVVKDYFGV